MTHRARKRFGQNFLVDRTVIDRIVEALRLPALPDPDAPPLVEIGPGLGALTGPLLARAGRLHAIEIDRDLVARFEQRALPGLTVHQRDVLEVDFADFAARLGSGTDPAPRLRLIGNLPYNIGTPLLLNLAHCTPALVDVHAMVQREVAQRLHAPPGDSHRGRLSVIMGAAFEVTSLFHVPPGAFDPAPKVQSALIRLVPRADCPDTATLAALERTTRIAFANRRKTLRNNLRGHLDVDALEAIGIDPGERAERIDLAGFLRLARALDADPSRTATIATHNRQDRP